MCNAQAYMWFFSVYCLYVCLVSSWAIKSTFLSLFPTSTLYKHRRWKSLTGAAHSWVGKGMHPSCLWRRAEEIELSWKFCRGTQCGKRRRRHTFISTYWDVIMQHWDDGLKRRRNCGAKFNACNYVFYETLHSLTSFFRVFTLCDMGTPFFLSDKFGTFVLSHLCGFFSMHVINSSGTQQSLRWRQELEGWLNYVRTLGESVGMLLCWSVAQCVCA
jgi:hypothetical protein